MQPLEIIAKQMIRRNSDDGQVVCGHRIGENDGLSLLLALEVAGYLVVPKEPTSEQIFAAHQADHGDAADIYRAMTGLFSLPVAF